MKKGTLKIIIAVIFLLGIIFVSSNYSSFMENYLPEEEKAIQALLGTTSEEALQGEMGETAETENVETVGTKTVHLKDKALLYENDYGDVVTMYLTVRTGSESEGTDHTWEEVNTYSAYYYEERGIDRYKVDALLQVGTEEGVPEGNLGYNRTAPNATVQIRGQSSTTNVQKNYKIELKENQGSWNGQKTIALNKHQSDGLRFRNKLGFDLLTGIDELMSLRTQFVHLYVNDLTDGEDTGFEDYGLYTQVEQLNKTALKNHGLDKTGQLYKINFFEFYRYEDVIKLSTDSSYDKDEFEKYLEIKGSEDHTKLIAMLEDLNDEGIPIESVIEKYFDMENLTYWMAFNILIGNADSQSRNAYLYSPQNLDTWYFLCWDIDACFKKDEYDLLGWSDADSWERGVSNYWGNVLFKRCLKSDVFRQELDKAVIDLKEYMSAERLGEMVTKYRAIVEPYIYGDADITYASFTEDQYGNIADSLPGLVDYYYQNYLDSLERPLPFFIGTPSVSGGKMNYSWENSYDFDTEDITYKAVVSTDLEGFDVVAEYEGYWNSFTGDKLEPGIYFMKVTATNESGFTQEAFDYYYSSDVGKYYGIICFYVNLDGTITLYDTEG